MVGADSTQAGGTGLIPGADGKKYPLPDRKDDYIGLYTAVPCSIAMQVIIYIYFIIAGPPAPVSWAALLASSKPAPNAQQPPAPAPMTAKPPAPLAKPEVKPDVGPTPQPQRAPRPPRDRPVRDRDSSRHAGDDDMGRRSRYPDNCQVFVGNLPHYMTEKDLKDYFERKYITLMQVVWKTE